MTELASHPAGYVRQVQIGKFNYFVNVKLFELLSQERDLMLKKTYIVTMSMVDQPIFALPGVGSSDLLFVRQISRAFKTCYHIPYEPA